MADRSHLRKISQKSGTVLSVKMVKSRCPPAPVQSSIQVLEQCKHSSEVVQERIVFQKLALSFQVSPAVIQG